MFLLEYFRHHPILQRLAVRFTKIVTAQSLRKAPLVISEEATDPVSKPFLIVLPLGIGKYNI
jgi:hypothetical protein